MPSCARPQWRSPPKAAATCNPANRIGVLSTMSTLGSLALGWTRSPQRRGAVLTAADFKASQPKQGPHALTHAREERQVSSEFPPNPAALQGRSRKCCVPKRTTHTESKHSNGTTPMYLRMEE